MEHLVESHLGGYYISDGDPELIEMYCETCGDYDRIVSSWNQYEDNGRINGLLRYFMINILNNREDINNKVDEFSDIPIEKEEIISSILNDIEFNSEEVFAIISDLLENREISDDEYTKILNISNFEKDRQIKMIKHFEKDILTKGNSGKVKVLKVN